LRDTNEPSKTNPVHPGPVYPKNVIRDTYRAAKVTTKILGACISDGLNFKNPCISSLTRNGHGYTENYRRDRRHYGNGSSNERAWDLMQRSENAGSNER